MALITFRESVRFCSDPHQLQSARKMLPSLVYRTVFHQKSLSIFSKAISCRNVHFQNLKYKRVVTSAKNRDTVDCCTQFMATNKHRNRKKKRENKIFSD